MSDRRGGKINAVLKEIPTRFDHRKLKKLVGGKIPYRLPKGYIARDSFSEIIVAATEITAHEFETEKYNDKVKRLGDNSLSQLLFLLNVCDWVAGDYPVYILEEGLEQDLVETEVINHPEVLQDFLAPFPSIWVNIAPGTIQPPINVEGDIDFVLISIIPINEAFIKDLVSKYVPFTEIDSVDIYTLEVSTMLTSGDSLSYPFAINIRTGQIISTYTDFLQQSNLIPSHIKESPNDKCGENLLTLALNICLLMHYEPDIIIEEPLVTGRGMGFGAKTNNTKQAPPRWIKQPPESKKRYPKREVTGTHASPCTHWRKAHWRNVRCGAGRQSTKRVRIPPILVNP